MVVALKNGHGTLFADAGKSWPISAFKNHRAVKSLLLAQVNARRVEVGKRDYWKITISKTQ